MPGSLLLGNYMNKYLEKIATSSLVGRVLKSTVGAGIDLAKGIGKQFDNATGGAYRDYAISKGVTSATDLSRVHLNRGELSRALRKTPEYKARLNSVGQRLQEMGHIKDPDKLRAAAHKDTISSLYGADGDFQKLQEKTRRARINSAALIGTGYVGYKKMKDNLDDRNQQITYQYQ